MKYILLFSTILLLNSCNDVVVRNNALHFVSPSGAGPHSSVALLSTAIGDKEYGFVEMDFSLATYLHNTSFGIFLRANAPDQNYLCLLGVDDLDHVKLDILALSPGGNCTVGSSLVTTIPSTSFVGNHTLGCELVLVGIDKIMSVYLDGVAQTSYLLGSNPLDTGGASTGKVGLIATTTKPLVGTPPENGIVITDFRYYNTKP